MLTANIYICKMNAWIVYTSVSSSADISHLYKIVETRIWKTYFIFKEFQKGKGLQHVFLRMNVTSPYIKDMILFKIF